MLAGRAVNAKEVVICVEDNKMDAVEALIGPDILVFHTTVWLKEPGGERVDRYFIRAGIPANARVTSRLSAWLRATSTTPPTATDRAGTMQQKRAARASVVMSFVLLAALSLRSVCQCGMICKCLK